MSLRQVVVIGAAAAVLAWTAAAAAQPPAALFGTWQLNAAKSTYRTAPPFVRATRTIEKLPDDRLKITDDMVRPRGGVVHIEWTGRLDGMDYPAEGFEDYAITYAYQPTGNGAFDIVQKSDGRTVGTAHMTVSADGRTLTTVTEGTGATAVYDKAAP